MPDCAAQNRVWGKTLFLYPSRGADLPQSLAPSRVAGRRLWAASGAGFGAIGGATTAVVAPLAMYALDPSHEPLTTGQTATAIATLAGGGVAAALG